MGVGVDEARQDQARAVILDRQGRVGRAQRVGGTDGDDRPLPHMDRAAPLVPGGFRPRDPRVGVEAEGLAEDQPLAHGQSLLSAEAFPPRAS